MRSYRKHSIATLLSCAILLTGLLLIGFSKWLNQFARPSLDVRTIDVFTLPPPPPPPPLSEQQDIDVPEIKISTTGSGPKIEMTLLTPEIEIDKKPIELEFNTQRPNWEESLTVDWQAFSLASLDSVPRLLNKPKYRLPSILRKRGIKRFDIVLDVVIDTKGRVHLVEIKSNPYPSFGDELRKLVKNARFSAPMKDGEPAKARFDWPLEIKGT